MRLIVVRGPSPAGPFELREGDNAAGRAPECEIFLPSKRVSRNHAVFSVQAGRVEVQDLGSHNGLLAGNGERVRSLTLAPGERVQVGDFLLLLDETPAQDELQLDEDELILDEDTAESGAGPVAQATRPVPPTPALKPAPSPPAAGAAPAPKPAPSVPRPTAPVAKPAAPPPVAPVPKPAAAPPPAPAPKPAAPAPAPPKAATPSPPAGSGPTRQGGPVPPAPLPPVRDAVASPQAPRPGAPPPPTAQKSADATRPAASPTPKSAVAASPQAAPTPAPAPPGPPAPSPIPPPPVLPFAPSGGFGGPRRPVPDPSRSVFLEPEEIDLDDPPPPPPWRPAAPDMETASVITRSPVREPDGDTSVSGPRAAPAPPWPLPEASLAPASSPSDPPGARPPSDEPPPPWRPSGPDAEPTIATPSAPPAWETGAPAAEPPPPWTPARGDHETSSAIRPSPVPGASLPFGPPSGGFAAPLPEPARPAAAAPPLPSPRPPAPLIPAGEAPSAPPVGVEPRRVAPPPMGEVTRGAGLPWLVQAACLVLVVMGLFLCAPVGGVFWQVHTQSERIEALSLLRGAALAESLANRNAQPLAEQRGLALDTAFLLERPGVRSALVADHTGTVMAPTEKLRTSITAVPVFVESARTGELVTLPTPDGLHQIAAPIRGQVNGSGPRQIVGFAVIEYDPAAVTEQLGSPVVGAVAGLFVAFIAAGVLAVGGWWLVLRPLAALREETELALLGDSQRVTSPVRLPQMEALAHSIHRAVMRAQSGAPRSR